MSRFGDILGLSLGLQERREAKTILEFLRERVDGGDRMDRRKSLGQRLGFGGMGCCGATWSDRQSDVSIMDDQDRFDGDDDTGPPAINQQTEVVESGRVAPAIESDPGCDGGGPVVSGMNLADALEAEREFRAVDEYGSGHPMRPENETEAPLRMSLMRLLEETDGEEEKEVVGSTGNDTVCCVCMGRKKGSAFIPCGHTFCRVCSRELWLNRGSCPLCNRPITEILDIF